MTNDGTPLTDSQGPVRTMQAETQSTDNRAKWTEKLFARLAAMYGARLADMWQGSNAEAVKAVWTSDLSAFTLEEIRDGIERLKDSGNGFPPTLPEFRAMCRASVASKRPEHQQFELPAPDMSAEAQARRDIVVAALKKLPTPEPSADWAYRAYHAHVSGEKVQTHDQLQMITAAIERDQRAKALAEEMLKRAAQ